MAEINWGLINNGGSGNALVAGLQAGTQQKAYNRKAELEETQLQGRVRASNALAKGDYEGAQKEALASGNPELVTAISQMSKAKREDLDYKLGKFGAIALGVSKLPQEQWGAAFAAAAPTLKQAGFSDEELASIDLTPEGLQARITGAMTLKDHLAQANSDRDYGLKKDEFGFRKEDAGTKNALTIRGQDRAAGDAAAGRAVTMRGQDIQARKVDATTQKGDNRAGMQIRKEFDSLKDVKDFNDVSNSYDIISDLAKRPGTAQDDIAAIFSFMKTLDPGSVVREGEFALAQNAAGVPTKIVNLYNKAISGERLTPGQRKELADTVKSVRDSRAKRYGDVVTQYQGYAREAGLPDTVIQSRVRPERGAALPAKVKNDADYDALPAGARFVGPDGKVRIKP